MSTTEPPPKKKHIYPSSLKNKEVKTTTVQTHYDKKEEIGLEKRKTSKILGVRNFNNWIKSNLIHQYVKQGDTVMDLACGKGGDLLKFESGDISNYIGVDISLESLKDLVKRYNQGKRRFPVKLIHMDATKAELSLSPVDVVSCQFAFHYCFETEKQARQMIHNVSSNLREGGFFIVTTPDAHVLAKKRMEFGPTYGNSLYEIEFKSSEFTQPYGLNYIFELKEAIDKCPEFLVPPETFVNLMTESRFKLVEGLNFHEYFEKYQHDKFLIHMLERDGLTKDDWDVAYLYKVYVFQKLGQPGPRPFRIQKNQNPMISEYDIISL